ncbi:GNAT family N-acetyltransferase [Shewanella litorisediminis]|uniref:GNAT family N-acetyltransferase n=1 Tax=Shewanella litorisediminis TaxID=1173586 RepID=A0ABX7G162_9GAMM|nr:GNAT family N-acetyltransferase [Shewanella litorisediminis]MCL2918956.1 GNAT family N-acetyltransferase [Shewanella litorisediminis]QRH01024.1 GNAT family N-acetyltransferase [Shewanella litorisediminis]
MQIRQASPDDIDQLVRLEQRFGRDELGNDDSRLEAQLNGRREFTSLIADHLVVVADDAGQIVAYAIVADEGFYQGQSFYRKLYQLLGSHQQSNTSTRGRAGKRPAPGCYGPVWVDSRYRGKGIFGALFDKVLTLSMGRYSSLFTFIAQENQHSLNVHVKRAGMEVVDFFEDDGRGFYLLQRL